MLAFVTLQCHAQAPLAAFFDEFTATWIRGNPDRAIATGYFTGPEQNRLERQLTPRSREYQVERFALAREGLERLRTVSREGATTRQQLAAEVMRWQLETFLAGEPYLDYGYPLNQHRGANVGLVNTLTVTHPFIDAQDAENYLVRLALVDDRLREAIARVERQEALGVRPPAFILRATIAQLQRFIRKPAEDNPFTTTLRDKTANMDGLSDAERQALVSKAAALVAAEVYPAWREAIHVLEGQLPEATEDAGLWRFPNGADHYAYRLARYTTTDLSAAQIHALGLEEVARIEAEMTELFDQLGVPEGGINERSARLAERLAYPDTAAGRSAIMARIDEILADSEARTAALFDRRPVTPVIARPYPEFRWANAAASYTAPPLDGSRPGVFQMPLRPERLTDFRLRTLVYHETVPGHHYQLALTTEDESLPRFMQIRAFGGISAITEGWALYAEHLAAESGWYDDDPAGLLGQLASALFRARRLVVDTGLHAEGWTRQQAIEYGIEASEVERYVVNPGQACSYMVGRLELVALRERMRDALGDEFSIRDFHNLVLATGIVPLEILSQQMDRNIAALKTD